MSNYRQGLFFFNVGLQNEGAGKDFRFIQKLNQKLKLTKCHALAGDIWHLPNIA
jgi:hypothetical protein